LEQMLAYIGFRQALSTTNMADTPGLVDRFSPALTIQMTVQHLSHLIPFGFCPGELPLDRVVLGRRRIGQLPFQAVHGLLASIQVPGNEF
jgi:hypothetical protein